MRSIFLINYITLLTILLVGCVDIKDEALKYRQVNLSLLKNDPNSRNSKTNDDLTLGIQRELIKVVQGSETFSTDSSKLTKIFDSNLTNLSTNKVSLSVPLGIPIKLLPIVIKKILKPYKTKLQIIILFHLANQIRLL